MFISNSTLSDTLMSKAQRSSDRDNQKSDTHFKALLQQAKADSVTPSDNQANAETKPAFSISIDGLESITHLMTFKPAPADWKPDPRIDFPTNADIENFINHQSQIRDVRDTRTIIRSGDEIIAVFNWDGSNMFESEAANLVKRAGIMPEQTSNRMEEIIRILQTQHSGIISVENFLPGSGPTNAEKFEMVNGYSFDLSTRQTVADWRADQAAAMQRRAAHETRMAEWNSVEQNQIYRVNDIVVGSFDIHGQLNIYTPALIQEIDQLGLGREVAKELLAMSIGSGKDQKTIEQSFEKAFADHLTIETYDSGNRPDRGSIADLSNQQFSDRYYAIQGSTEQI